MEAAEKALLAPVQQSSEFGSDYTSALFRWAVSLVLSRSFEVTLGDDKRLAIIPLVDYLNHKPFASQVMPHLLPCFPPPHPIPSRSQAATADLVSVLRPV